MRAEGLKVVLKNTLLKYRKRHGYGGYPQLRMNSQQMAKNTATVNCGDLLSEEETRALLDFILEDIQEVAQEANLSCVIEPIRMYGQITTSQIRFYYDC